MRIATAVFKNDRCGLFEKSFQYHIEIITKDNKTLVYQYGEKEYTALYYENILDFLNDWTEIKTYG